MSGRGGGEEFSEEWTTQRNAPRMATKRVDVCETWNGRVRAVTYSAHTGACVEGVRT